jgi:hypothetical protein
VLNDLNIKSETEIRSVEVYSMTGQRIKSVTLKTHATAIDLNDITQGTYFVAVTLKNGTRSIQKIVKK